MNSDVLTFDPNTDYLLALRYEKGRQVSNGRFMFSTPEDEKFFLDPPDADQLHSLGLKVNEAFFVRMNVTGAGKARKKSFRFWRAEEAAQTQPEPALRTPAPAVTATTTALSAAPPAPISISKADPSTNAAGGSQSFSNVLASSYIAAIDGLLRAKEYADSKGVSFTLEPIRITAEDLRATANSVFIQYWKQQEQLQRRGAA
jgi:hypothetical protein